MRHSTLLASFVLSTVSFVPAVLSSTHRVAADVDMPAALKSLPLSSPVSDERGTEAERFQSSSHRKTSPGKSKGDGTKWKAPIPAEDIKPSTDISTEDGGFIVPDVLSIPFVWLFTSLLEKKGLRDGASGHMPTDQSSSTNVDKKRSRSSRSPLSEYYSSPPSSYHAVLRNARSHASESIGRFSSTEERY